MRLLNRLFLFISLFFTVLELSSQEVLPQYTVQIGNFVNPRPADFSALNSIGFVYAVNRPNNYTDVFMGGYHTQGEANRVAQLLIEKGYNGTSVSKLNVEGGQNAAMVQVATKTVGDNINWEELLAIGKLYFILEGQQIKILTGVFADLEAAKIQLPRIKSLGFKDAFAKYVNNALLHEVTDFEAGSLAKKPLIPLDFSEKPVAQEKKTDVPASYDNVSTLAVNKSELTEKGVPGPPKPAIREVQPELKREETKTFVSVPDKNKQPTIRGNVKRTSAIELQKVLKAEGAYKGSLDGYYGKGTRASYEQALNSNRQLNKYRILARHMANPGDEAPSGSVQYYINNLWDNPKTMLNGLEASKAPIAKAYRAYFQFVNNGANKEVDLLMNQAINEAFSGKKGVSFPKFDPAASYAYFDLDQLLLHIRYIHQVSPEKPAAPCWLFRKHSGPALRAFDTNGVSGGDLKLQNCGGFWEWEEVQILHAIAQDLCSQDQTSEAKNAATRSQIAQLYLTPKALSDNESKALEAWNGKLWKGIDAWATRDPMFAEISTALKISYFQTQVLLEDYFMDEGFDERAAKGLALAAMKALVGSDLERFV